MHNKDGLNNSSALWSGAANQRWLVQSSFIRTQFHRNSGCVDDGRRCWWSKCPSRTITAASCAVACSAGFCGFAEQPPRPRRGCSRWHTEVGAAALSVCRQPECRGCRRAQRAGLSAPTATTRACAGGAEGDGSWRLALQWEHEQHTMWAIHQLQQAMLPNKLFR